jgi:anti-sigma factor RsiW
MAMTQQQPLNDAEREKLVAYLDGELDDKTARTLETKIGRDSQLRAEADTLRRTWELLDFLPQPEASAALSSRTIESVSTLRPTPRRRILRDPVVRRWVFGLGWAAAVLVAFISGFAGTDSVIKRNRPPAQQAVDVDQLLVGDHRVIENERLYQNVDDIGFVRQLDDPELFGDDS